MLVYTEVFTSFIIIMAIAMIVTINNHSDIRIARKTSGLRATAVFAACSAGGVLFGPIGLAIGASVGGATAIKMTRKNTKSLVEFVNGLSKKQKKKLAVNVMENVMRVFYSRKKKDQNLLLWMCRHDKVPIIVTKTVFNYITKDLDMRIIENKK